MTFLIPAVHGNSSFFRKTTFIKYVGSEKIADFGKRPIETMKPFDLEF